MIAPRKKTLPKPLMHRTEYNIPGGTEVLIKLKSGIDYQGIVLCNPAATRSKETIELINATNSKTGQKVSDSVYLSDLEILSVEIIAEVNTKRLARKEIIVETHIVDNKAKLDTFVGTLTDVKELGVAFHGIKSGRFGRVVWILLSVNDVAVAIDVLSMEELRCAVWQTLKKPLFENQKIVKIFHNSRPEVDYLFHRESITVKNIYDTQLIDYLLDKKEERNLKNVDQRHVLMPLYAAINKYLPHVAFERDIAFLSHFHKCPKFTYDTVKYNPILVRPPEKEIKKYFIMSVKFLTRLKEEVEFKKNTRFRQFFEDYMRSTIDNDMFTANVALANEELLPEDLPNIIDRVFAKTQASDDPERRLKQQQQ